MLFKNTDRSILFEYDKKLWHPDIKNSDHIVCEHCKDKLIRGYYDINNLKLCRKCAKIEFKEYFEELEDLEELKQTCVYDSIEQLIEDTIDEDLYKFWKRF